MSFVSFGVAPWHATVVNIPTARRLMRPQGLVSWSRQALATDEVGFATLTLTGLPTGCDIVVLTAGTTTVLDQYDAVATTSFAYVYPYFDTTAVVDIGFIKQGFVPFYIRGLALPAQNSTIPVALTPDRNFL